MATADLQGIKTNRTHRADKLVTTTGTTMKVYNYIIAINVICLFFCFRLQRLFIQKKEEKSEDAMLETSGAMRHGERILLKIGLYLPL